jgi:tetratricopeptide (TPR) repeat protein
MPIFVGSDCKSAFTLHLDKIMKNQILFYIIIISSLPLYSWAQKIPLNSKKIEGLQTNAPILSDEVDATTRKVKYYYVEEIVDLKFGGHKTVYKITSPKLIQTNDLGPNSKRIITTIFENGEQLVEIILKSDDLKKFENSTKLSLTDTPKETNTVNLGTKNKRIEALDFLKKEQLDETTIKLNSLDELENPTKFSITDTPKKVNIPANIDIIKIYESVAEKGYETLDILKKLANTYFFNNELEKAEKYYRKLFSKTTDLEPEYYYRYSVALKSIGQIEKSNELLKKFNQLSDNSSK